MDAGYKILRGIVFLILLSGFFISGPANATKSYQIVKNGGFESGNTGWVNLSSCLVDTPGGMYNTGGAYGDKFAYIGYPDVYDSIYQKLYLPGNASAINLSYKYQYWDDLDYVGGYGAVGLFKLGTATLYSATFYNEDNDTGEGTSTGLKSMTSLRGKNIEVHFSVSNTGGYNNKLFIDSVSVIVKTPSPTLYGTFRAFKYTGSGLITVYRLKYKKTGTYYYTKSSSIKTYLAKHGYSYIGKIYAYSSYKSNATAVYSLRNKKTGAYKYTTSLTSKTYLTKHGYSYKGIILYAPK